MENQEITYTAKNQITVVFLTLLTLFGILVNVNAIIHGLNHALLISNIVVFLGILCYAGILYKVPHSNFFKYLLLLFAVSLVFNSYFLMDLGLKDCFVMLFFAGVSIGYMAGRLDRIKQNTVITVYIFALFVYIAMRSSFGTDAVNSNETLALSVSQIIAWLDITASYYIRFKAHKNAPNE